MEAVIVNSLPRGHRNGVALAIMIVSVGLFSVFIGCDPSDVDAILDSTPADNAGLIAPADPSSESHTPLVGRQAIIVGSFNIQTFGRGKMSKSEVVSVLVDIARRYDILAIQELRDVQQETIPEFLRLINQNGSHYRAAVSQRIGYTDVASNRRFEEQLVYLYDSDQVEIIGQPYVAQDRYALMHRPPYVAHFRCRVEPRQQAFSCVLMNVHVDPDDTVAEFTALQDIIRSIFPNHPGEDDFILLGDMNAEASKFTGHRWLADQFATIPPHWKTNTRQKESYDNITFDARRTAEFLNQAGVMNLMQEYNLSREAAIQVSDHMPIWAVFASHEFFPAELTQEQQLLR